MKKAAYKKKNNTYAKCKSKRQIHINKANTL